jgi:hypothetical protein
MEIKEAYEALSEYTGSQWVKIADIQELTNQAPAVLAAAIIALMQDRSFRAEPEPFGHRIDDRARRTQVMIGGEYRHHIAWV